MITTKRFDAACDFEKVPNIERRKSHLAITLEQMEKFARSRTEVIKTYQYRRHSDYAILAAKAEELGLYYESTYFPPGNGRKAVDRSFQKKVVDIQTFGEWDPYCACEYCKTSVVITEEHVPIEYIKVQN